MEPQTGNAEEKIESKAEPKISALIEPPTDKAEEKAELKTEPKISALIVDDNFFNRDIFRIALEHAGYEVAYAEDGIQGLEMLESRGYTLLVLDLQMPRMDGRGVLRKIRGEDGHYKGMSVVVVTANSQMATDDIRDLADYVMYKPINIPEFSDFVKRLRDASLRTARPT